MAMSRCRECGKEVSTEAQSCPHCGAMDPTGVGLKHSAKTPAGHLDTKATVGCLILAVVLFGWCFAAASNG